MVDLPVRQIMTANAERIAPHASVQAAARSMKARNIGLVVVYDPVFGVVGVVTDRDIALRAVAMGRDPMTTEVREVMTTDVATCCDTDDVETAAHAMERRCVRRLVVLDSDGALVGVVSLDDIARTFGADWLAGALARHTAAWPTG